MITASKGICSECAKQGDYTEKFIVNKKYKLCPYHNKIRLQANKQKQSYHIKQKRYSESFPYSTQWGYTSEMEMFQDIWANRPHISFFTGRPIWNFHPGHFLHVLPKALNKYPHFRLNPNNIVLGTLKEHHLADFGTHKEREAYRQKFPNYSIEPFMALAERLKKEYVKMFQD